jgi:hypothetical protein
MMPPIHNAVTDPAATLRPLNWAKKLVVFGSTAQTLLQSASITHRYEEPAMIADCRRAVSHVLVGKQIDPIIAIVEAQ